MKNRRNYYRLLQVQPDAPAEVIHASYRTLMKELRQHPDLGGSASGAALLNEAYRVLSDPVRRAAYDQELSKRYPRRTPPAAASVEETGLQSFCRFCKGPLEDGERPGRRCLTCKIPLRSGKGDDLERLARRAVGRTRRRDRISFRTQWPQEPYEGTMTDLSPTGMRFLSRARLAPGAILKIVGPDFEASAIVKNVAAGAAAGGEDLFAVGVAFLAVDFERPRGSFLSASA